MAIDEENAQERAVNGSAIFGVGILSDLTDEEFKTFYLGTIVPADYESRRTFMEVAPPAVHTSELTSVDWRGIYTTPIKDQGQCGSCWYAQVY